MEKGEGRSNLQTNRSYFKNGLRGKERKVENRWALDGFIALSMEGANHRARPNKRVLLGDGVLIRNIHFAIRETRT